MRPMGRIEVGWENFKKVSIECTEPSVYIGLMSTYIRLEFILAHKL